MEAKQTLNQTLQRYGSLPPRFEPLAIIGGSPSSVVIRARESLIDREVAIKILEATAVEGSAQFARFTRELKLLGALDHKHIVKIFSSGITDGGHPYHVLELLDGTTLSDRLLKERTLSAELFFSVFCQVLEGLEYAHSNHVVHRDLKPSNLMICKQGNEPSCTKIIDFGVATLDETEENASSTLTGTGILIGTPLYMSPEQCGGTPAQSKSDLYSLGCIMYQCLSGSPPFSGQTSMELMYKHVHESARALKLEDVRLSALIADCLKKRPADRPTAAEALSRMNKLSQEFSRTLRRPHLVKAAAISFTATLTVLVAGPIAYSLFTHFSAHNSAELVPATKSRTQLRALQLLREDVARQQNRYDKAKETEKKEQGLLLCQKIQSLCDQLGAGEDCASEEFKRSQQEKVGLYNRILQICKCLDGIGGLDITAQANLWLAINARNSGHYEQCLNHVQKALEPAREASLTLTEANLYALQASANLALHNLKEADNSVDKAIHIWNEEVYKLQELDPLWQRNQGSRAQSPVEMNNQAFMVISATLEQHFDTNEQKKEALEICNKLTKFLLQPDSKQSQDAAAAGLELLERLPKNTSGYDRLCIQTQKLAEEEAKLRSDSAGMPTGRH